jgi:hypothetical protein
VPPDPFKTEQMGKIAEELSVLSKQQSLALQQAAYLSMSKDDAQKYDERRIRIGQICDLLARFKP